MNLRPPQTGAKGLPRGVDGVEGNARLTATLGLLLIVLLAAEGVTILRIHQLITVHVAIGALLLPPVLLKIASTGHRMLNYYRGAAAYRLKGPPPILLRLLGPFVVMLTVEVLATGVALVYAAPGWHRPLLFLHKAGFVLWFGAMSIHVLGHLPETYRHSLRDWATARRWRLRGAGIRRGLVIGSLLLGALAAALLASTPIPVGH